MLALLAAVTPTPTPTPVDPTTVTPGPWGFAVIALLAIVVILLVGDMVRRIRRVSVRDDIRAELDAEEAALAAGGSADVERSDDAAPRDDDPADGRR